ncbi:MAG TPA: acyltransferase, partial [Sediminispirochaeta sp.]|nr:acyltransferase [Sediminispirochaeta sp.]
METADDFEDIRPYRDDEVYQVLHRMYHDDWLISGIRTVFLRRVPRFLAPLFDRLTKTYLGMKLKNIRTVDDFQRKVIVDTILHHLVTKTINGLSYEG